MYLLWLQNCRTISEEVRIFLPSERIFPGRISTSFSSRPTNFDENIHKASPSTVLGLLTCSAEKQIKQNFSPDIRVFLSITSSSKRSSGLREKEKSADKEFGGQAVLVSFRGSLKNNDLSVRNIGKSQVVLITAVLVLC